MAASDDFHTLETQLLAAQRRVDAAWEAQQLVRNTLAHVRDPSRQHELMHDVIHRSEAARVALETAERDTAVLKRAIEEARFKLAHKTNFWVTSPYVREQHAVVARAARILRLAEVLVPARLRQEEIGDALEVIHRLAREAEPGWRQLVAMKVATTIFWIAVNTLRDFAAGLLGPKSA